jgi:hypothetical protein
VARVAALAAIAMLTACFDPGYRAGAVCSERGTCPPGQTCGPDGFCGLGGAGPADASADAPADGPALADADLSDADVSDAGDEPDAADIADASVDATVDAAVDATVDAAPAFCGNLVPALGGPDDGVVSAGSLDGYPPWQVFDGVTNSMWISPDSVTPAIIGYQWSSPRPLVRYAIHYVNGSITERAPRDWTLQGFDGSTWITLQTVSGQPAWSGNERRVFTLPTSALYYGFRLVITEDFYGGAGLVVTSMGTLELLGPDCP